MEEMRNGLHQDAPEAEAATEPGSAAEEGEPGAKQQEVATSDSDLEPVPKRARTAAAMRKKARALGRASTPEASGPFEYQASARQVEEEEPPPPPSAKRRPGRPSRGKAPAGGARSSAGRGPKKDGRKVTAAAAKEDEACSDEAERGGRQRRSTSQPKPVAQPTRSRRVRGFKPIGVVPLSFHIPEDACLGRGNKRAHSLSGATGTASEKRPKAHVSPQSLHLVISVR